MQEDRRISEHVAGLAASACVELFDAYDVTLSPSEREWTECQEQLLCSVVGFVGRRLRGTCLLAGTQAALGASCPTEGRLRDWAGELANQLTGRLRSKFLAREIEVALTTPIVLSGVQVQPLPRLDLKPTVFTSSAGDIMVWAEVEAAEDFEFGEERPTLHGGEGDILMF